MDQIISGIALARNAVRREREKSRKIAETVFLPVGAGVSPAERDRGGLAEAVLPLFRAVGTRYPPRTPRNDTL